MAKYKDLKKKNKALEEALFDANLLNWEMSKRLAKATEDIASLKKKNEEFARGVCLSDFSQIREKGKSLATSVVLRNRAIIKAHGIPKHLLGTKPRSLPDFVVYDECEDPLISHTHDVGSLRYGATKKKGLE